MYQVKRNNLISLSLIVIICLIKLFHIGYYRINFSSNLLFHAFEKDFAKGWNLMQLFCDENNLG